MKKIQDLRGLLIEQLKDRYDAAKQQAEMYPRLVEAATHAGLKSTINADIDSNKDHLKKLEELLTQLGEKADGERCEGTQGLVYEANEVLNYADSDLVLNIGIAMSVQHVNHHDIAGHNSCILYAQALGETETTEALSRMLANEQATDEALNAVAKQILEDQSK